MTFQVKKTFVPLIICAMSLIVAQFSIFAPVAYAGCKADIKAQIEAKKAEIAQKTQEIDAKTAEMQAKRAEIDSWREAKQEKSDAIDRKKEVIRDHRQRAARYKQDIADADNDSDRRIAQSRYQRELDIIAEKVNELNELRADRQGIVNYLKELWSQHRQLRKERKPLYAERKALWAEVADLRAERANCAD